MLGKLFTLGYGATGSNAPQPAFSSPGKPVLSLESVQEDLHTRTLLFPDPQTLGQHRNDQLFPFTSLNPPLSSSPIHPFDYNPDICIDDRDVRVLVMQDGLGTSVSASLLFDSHPVVPPQTQPASATAADRGNIPDSWKSPMSPRRGSVPHSAAVAGARGIAPEGPQPRAGAFDRRSSATGRFPIIPETESQKASREYREEIATFMSCTFGNSELFSYKGTSTKVHLIPTESRPLDNATSSSYVGDGRNSMGRSSTRSRFGKSYSSDIMSPAFPPNLSYATTASANTLDRQNDGKRVLITRLFPVVLPVDSDASSNQAQQDPTTKRPQQRPKRTPMYAVVLVVNLQALSSFSSKPAFRGPGSFNENDSLPSSYGSCRRMAWNTPGSAMPEPVDFYLPESDERLEHITQHWDIIRRTLTQLQSSVATTIGNLLKQVDMFTSDPVSAYPSYRAPPINPKTSSKPLALKPLALMGDDLLAQQAAAAQLRIVSGLQAERVCTGQGRWSTWRDEARLIARMQLNDRVDGREFFYKLLTGFLASHTQWLQALGPDKYRLMHMELERSKGEEDVFSPARTIIVSRDKMAARRLIFLLSAFLPAKTATNSHRSLRPSTSASLNYSVSPPAFSAPGINREQSLRRIINGKSEKGRVPSHRRTPSQSTRNSNVPSGLAHLTLDGNYSKRRESDDLTSRAASFSMYGASNNGAAMAEPKTKKSSVAASTTATPESVIAHIATVNRGESRRAHRPGSSNSIVTDDLKRSLQRSENGHENNTASRWGSIMSNIWGGNARRNSTTLPAQPSVVSPIRGTPRTPVVPSQRTSPNRTDGVGSLAFTTEEISSTVRTDLLVNKPESSRSNVSTPRGLHHERSRSGLQNAADIQPRQPIDMPHPFGTPVKSSVNPKDGVIDIDIPFTDMFAWFETAVSSPSSSGYLSTPGAHQDGLAFFEQSCQASSDGDTPLNVAGWIQQFHPDFALQAVPPSDDLVNSVKEALRNEPSPTVPQLASQSSPESSSERWVDVSSALIADMTTGFVTHILYRRLIVPRERPVASKSHKGGPYGSGTFLTPLIAPYEVRHDEDFIFTTVTTIEELLGDAIDRVLAQSGDLTSVSSMTDLTGSKSTVGSLKANNSSMLDPASITVLSTSMPSPSSMAANRGSSLRIPLSPSQQTQQSSVPRDMPNALNAQQHVVSEVPRGQCKTVVLRSLAAIVHDVVDNRERLLQDDADELDGDESMMREAIRAWIRAVASPADGSPRIGSSRTGW